MSAVSPATAAALEEAMQRLLEGRPARTDGTLTVANLAREAGVSRATANRATDILSRFRARTSPDSEEDLPVTLRTRIRDLTAQVAEFRRRENQEITSLRATVSTLAQHVQALTLENRALRDAIKRDADVTRMSDRIRDRRDGTGLILPEAGSPSSDAFTALGVPGGKYLKLSGIFFCFV